MNEAFTFYGSFYDAISELDDADRLAVYDAICGYGITGKVPELTGVAALAFKLMRPNIDENLKRRAAGKAGGEQTQSKPEAKPKQTGSKPEAKPKQQDKTKQDKTEQDKTKKTERFAPPSLDDVRAYCAERKNGVQAEAFVDFYASKGWKVGNQPMKDWKAAVRTWERREKPQAPPGKVHKIGDYDRSGTDWGAVERALIAKGRGL